MKPSRSWPRHRLPSGPGGRITISVRLRGLQKLQVEALQEEELRKLEAERGGLDPDADPGAEEAADLS